MLGYLFQGVGLLVKNKFVTMLIIIGLFTALHLTNPEFNDNFSRMLIEYLLISATFGLIAVLDDGLEISIGIHSANNIFLAIIISVKGGTLNTDAIFQVSKADMILHSSLLQSFATTVIIMLLFGFVYRWKFSTLFSKPIIQPAHTVEASIKT